MLPAEMLTGTLALTVVWLALASEFACCSVSATWVDSCDCPLPPQPFVQLEGPLDWVWLLVWLVVASFSALLSAPLVLVWLALLFPVLMLPAETLTGTL